jgi:hypothetical protein
LQELVKEKVDWYLDELVGELELQTGKLVSIPTLWRSLVYCGISRKKVKLKFSNLLQMILFYDIYCFILLVTSGIL